MCAHIHCNRHQHVLHDVNHSTGECWQESDIVTVIETTTSDQSSHQCCVMMGFDAHKKQNCLCRRIKHADPRWQTDKNQVRFAQKGLFKVDVSVHHAMMTQAIRNYHKVTPSTPAGDAVCKMHVTTDCCVLCMKRRWRHSVLLSVLGYQCDTCAPGPTLLMVRMHSTTHNTSIVLKRQLLNAFTAFAELGCHLAPAARPAGFRITAGCAVFACRQSVGLCRHAGAH